MGSHRHVNQFLTMRLRFAIFGRSRDVHIIAWFATLYPQNIEYVKQICQHIGVRYPNAQATWHTHTHVCIYIYIVTYFCRKQTN